MWAVSWRKNIWTLFVFFTLSVKWAFASKCFDNMYLTHLKNNSCSLLNLTHLLFKRVKNNCYSWNWREAILWVESEDVTLCCNYSVTVMLLLSRKPFFAEYRHLLQEHINLTTARQLYLGVSSSYLISSSWYDLQPVAVKATVRPAKGDELLPECFAHLALRKREEK